MKKSDYKQLKRQAQERYERTIADAERQLSEGLRAIEAVWRMMHPPRKHKPQITPQNQQTENLVSTGIEPQAYAYGDLKANVLKAVKYMPAEFTCNHILDETKRATGIKFKYSSVANRLKRLAKEDKLKIVKQGRGKSPTVYKRITTENEEKLE